MADIRINALATTAASTASDDFVAVDGSANGTRKLNAYSPTFGGNLTVSGTGGGTFTGPVTFGSPTNIGSASAVWMGGNGSSGAFFNVPTGANIQLGINNSGLVSVTSTATTLQNNLTVSGTGTTALGGAGSIISLSTSGRLQLGVTYSRVADPDGAGGWLGGYNIKFSTSPKYDSTGATAGLYYSSNGVRIYSGGTAVADTAAPLVATFATNGNVLVGTTTDSSNGIIQLATHTTSAGGIGFGTDTSLYRTAAGDVSLDGPGGSDAILRFKKGGVEALRVESNVGSGYITASGTLYVRSGGSTALTLDSSQNATFAGNVTLSNSGNAFFNLRYGSGGFGMVEFTRNSVNKGRIYQNSSDELFIESATANQAIKLVGTDATFAGAIAIGNTVNTVSPTSPNRTITMVIGGTTYYIHAKTTND